MSRDSDKLDQILAQVKKLDSVEATVKDIDARLLSLSTTVGNLQSTVSSHTSEIAEIKADLAKHKTEIRTIKTAQHLREQRLRSTTVRLFNFPYQVGESLDNFKALSSRVYDRIIKPTLVAAKSSGDLGSVPQQQTAVEACFRFYSPNQPEAAASSPPPPVIIRLSSNSIKSAVMKNRRCIPPPSDGEKSGGVRRFIIVEDLTPEAYGLLKALQQDRRTDKVWSYNGVIH